MMARKFHHRIKKVSSGQKLDNFIGLDSDTVSLKQTRTKRNNSKYTNYFFIVLNAKTLQYAFALTSHKAHFEATKVANFLSVHRTGASLCLQRPKNPELVIDKPKQFLWVCFFYFLCAEF